MEFQDRVLTCVGCQQEFIFSAGEQEFFQQKGFTETPKRCKPCRAERAAQRQEVSDRPPRTPREMFDAVCATCGAAARVPFQPAPGRPVYCRPCHQDRMGAA